ncbi:MAG: fasciclin protein [Spirosoma sp.]|nr:fasciclin protein [Spirosoma sp.]
MIATLRNTRFQTISLLLTSLFVFILTFTACKNKANEIALPVPRTIPELLNSNSKFTLLSAALNRAGLATTLAGTGPFTLFAPTDDAFRAAGYADAAAINAAPTATLASILQYHLLNSSVGGSAITTGQSAQATALATNGTVYLSKAASTSGGTGLSINEGRVLQADVLASNGVVHIIDRVLMPPTGNILAIAQADTSLSLLAAAALRGGAQVTSALGGTTPLTVFAPTNSAFRAAGFANAAAINAAPIATLTNILTYHVIPGVRAYSPTLVNGATIPTFQTGTVTVGVSSTGLTVTGKGNGGTASKITTPDISATNGVIHKIDRVLMP